MTKFILYISAFASFILLAALTFNNSVSLFLYDNPHDPLTKEFRNALSAFEAEVGFLQVTADAFNKASVSKTAIQDHVSKTRNAFKSVEFLVAYIASEDVNKFINGAPLQHRDPTYPGNIILEPNGLQTLDELAYSDNPKEHSGKILKLSKKLLNDIRPMINFLKTIELDNRIILESTREEILRIYTLGLTGFDTPGSLSGVSESAISLNSMHRFYSLLKKQIVPNDKWDKLFNEIITHLKSWEDYLEKNKNFNSLDRLHILKHFFNPLYQDILSLHDKLGAIKTSELDPIPYAVNPNARNIFSDSFFNASVYAKVASNDLYDPKKIALGQILFYDPILSKNLSMSCASCHNPMKAFTDGKKTSVENPHRINRNAPTLINSSIYPNYFYDMREYSLERQVKHVVYDQDEFNFDFIELAERLKKSPEYIDLFKEAYGDQDKYIISTWSIANALASFVNDLKSFNSPFDRYARGEVNEVDSKIVDGYNLFMGKAACGTCHFAPSFSGIVPPRYEDGESEVLGVLRSWDTIRPVLDDDPGRIASGKPEDEVPFRDRSFKTVTVRNAELTAPYMHNGSLASLEEVMEFYDHGGGAGLGLAVENQTLSDEKLDLTDYEKSSIIAFIESLTDTTGMTNLPRSLPKFEDGSPWNDRNIKY